MDKTDRRIINLLCENGRRSNVDIARRLSVSEGTVRKRLDQLLEDGALEIKATVDPVQAGYKTRVLILLTIELPHMQEAEEMLRDTPEVSRIYRITGEHDLVIDVVLRSDDHLRSFIAGRLNEIPGIIRTETFHVLRVQEKPIDWTRSTTPHILIVDDDPDFIEATRMILAREDYTISAASNGDEALKAMVANPPDLVILDIMMDGILDGGDASRRIRTNSQLRDTPILVVSSITASDYLSMLPTDDDNLIDNFLSKPVAPERLLTEVDRLLRRA
ncbi:MAG: response regulator [Chloroflexota bacterium]|nr:response regulator [Chloroflexota bacterium]